MGDHKGLVRLGACDLMRHGINYLSSHTYRPWPHPEQLYRRIPIPSH